MRELTSKLKQISEKILFTAEDFGAQREACHELYDFLSALTGISPERDNAEQSFLDGGKAISPNEAAMCVLDFARTIKFSRGTYAALQELKKRFPGERLEILYAGCGPFAALILPILTQLAPEEISLTLIDYHRRSIESAEEILRRLELEKFAVDFVCADAAGYTHDKKFHLIISETMQAALKKEPQAAVMLSLAPQLLEKGIFIPQKISIDACLGNSEKERVYLARIFELDAEKIRQSSPENLRFPPFTLEIPAADIRKPDFILLTTVRIYDEFELSERDSAITYPTILRDLNNLPSGSRISFEYVIDENPRFEYFQL